MKKLTDFIKENKFKLRNIEIYEELKDIDDTGHSLNRKKAKYDVRDFGYSDNLGGINNNLIKDIFSRINEIIENKCLSGEIEIDKSEIGVCFREDHNTKIILIFFITRFDKSTFEYDILLRTVERYPIKKKFIFHDILFWIDIYGKNKKIKDETEFA